MPNHKQFKKALRVNERARIRNKIMKSRVATLVKKVKSAESQEAATQALNKAVSAIDTIARKGVIKKETAARRKSRLYKHVARMQ